MIYSCRDCGYSGKTGSANGQCPACGSYDYHRATAGQEDGKPQQASPFKLGLLIVLWGYLITEIYWKLYG